MEIDELGEDDGESESDSDPLGEILNETEEDGD